MSDTELTAEEQQALEAMANEAPEEPETPAEPEQEEKAPEAAQEAPESDEKPEDGSDVEFKSQRTEKPPEGFVPHAAMHAERVKRQELEKRLAELEAKLPAPEPEKTPQYVDPLEDPEGFKRYDEWRSKQTEKRLDEILQQRQADAERLRNIQQAERFEQEFAAKTPDYYEATKALTQARMSQLQGMGYGDEEIRAQMQKDATAIFQAAQMAGMNPAQLVYMRAQEYGYQPKRPEPKDDPAEKITALASAQKATQGLGNVGGGEQPGKLTAAQLAEMSEAELAKIPDEDIARAFGA